jgi:hypothetical protein
VSLLYVLRALWLRGCFGRLPVAGLGWLARLFLNPTFLAAFLKFILRNFAVAIRVDHLEIDDEGSCLVFRQSVTLSLCQTPNSLTLGIIQDGARAA